MAANRALGFVGRISAREALDRLVVNVRGGQIAVLVNRGGAGMGKTALLRYAARRAAGFRIAHIAGVEAEMELPGYHRARSDSSRGIVPVSVFDHRTGADHAN
jgi:hypothetical protein